MFSKYNEGFEVILLVVQLSFYLWEIWSEMSQISKLRSIISAITNSVIKIKVIRQIYVSNIYPETGHETQLHKIA